MRGGEKGVFITTSVYIEWRCTHIRNERRGLRKKTNKKKEREGREP